MKLWTIQEEVFWERLEYDGSIVADPELVASGFSNGCEQFSLAYEWMVQRMAEKIGRPFPEALPLWAWQQWCGEHRARPDLRSSAHLPKGERGVRIEFEADPDSVVLSDFDLWHFPLNCSYIGESEEDCDSFDEELEAAGHKWAQGPPLDPVHRKRFEDSWNRVFDLDSDDWLHNHGRSDKSIQATLWRIPLDAVVDVRRFTAR